jgi:hypothetical protein
VGGGGGSVVVAGQCETRRSVRGKDASQSRNRRKKGEDGGKAIPRPCSSYKAGRSSQGLQLL